MERLQSTLEKIILFDEEYNTHNLQNNYGDHHIVIDVTFEYSRKKYYICQQSKVSPEGSQYALNIYIDNQETNYDVFFIRSLEVELKRQVG